MTPLSLLAPHRNQLPTSTFFCDYTSVRQLTFLESLLQNQTIIRVCGVQAPISSLLTDYLYIEIFRSDDQMSRTPPRRSLQVDAGVVVGLNEQAVTLLQGSNGTDRQRERWEVLVV